MNTEPLIQELASRLRAYRAKLNMTLREAADKSGIHWNSVSRYEHNGSVPIEALYRLANAYDLDINDLVPSNKVIPPVVRTGVQVAAIKTTKANKVKADAVKKKKKRTTSR